MAQDPKNRGGFYHITLPLETLDDTDPDADDTIIRPVSKGEAEALIRLFQEVHRNQPCPCGSDLAFAECCERKSL